MEYKVRNAFERHHYVPTWVQWSEVIGLTLVVIAIGFWLRPEDPFYIKAPFPWVLLGPLVAALHYGFYAGLVSAVLLFLSLLGYVEVTVGDVYSIPFGYVVGVMVITMLAGEFRDYWASRLEVLQHSNHFRQVRLDEFTRSYHLLKVSHDRLEVQLAGRGQSLREALRYLQQHLHRFGASLTPEVAKSVLDILVEYGSFQVAAVVPVLPSGEVASHALAEVGDLYEVDVHDPMVRFCLDKKELVSIKEEHLESNQQHGSQYLIVIPLVDSKGGLYALVVVKLLPFFEFEQETLTLLAVLAGHMADLFHFYQLVPDAKNEEELEFKVNLKRAVLDKEKHNVPASLVVIRVAADELGRAFVNIVQEMKRGLDVVWVQEEMPQKSLLVQVLLPVTDEMGLAGYRQRLEDNVRQRFGQDLETLVQQVGYHSLTTVKALQQFLKSMGVDYEL